MPLIFDPRSLRTHLFILIFCCIWISLFPVGYLLIKYVDSAAHTLVSEKAISYGQSAKSLYDDELNTLLTHAQTLADNPQFIATLQEPGGFAQQLLSHIASSEGVDIALVVNEDGYSLINANPIYYGQHFSFNGILAHAQQTHLAFATTEGIRAEELLSYDPNLLYETKIRRVPTLNQREIPELYHNTGMVQFAVVPIQNGAIVLGELLNRDNEYVDSAKSVLDIDISLFHDDVRIATSLLTRQNNRFIGTLMPQEVYISLHENEAMLLSREWFNGKNAQVAHVPINDHLGNVIGAISLAIPESFFFSLLTDKQKTTLFIFALIITTFFSVLGAILLYKTITGPLQRMISQTQDIMKGDFEHGLSMHSYTELNELAHYVNIMARYLRKYMVKKEREVIESLNEYRKKTNLVDDDLMRISSVRKLKKILSEKKK